MRRFCYKCGVLEREAGQLIEGLCQKCFLETIRVDLPSKVEITSCKNCGMFLIGGDWVRSSREDILKQVLKKARLPQGLEICVRITGNKAILSIMGKVHKMQEKPVEIERIVEIREKLTTCKLCSLKKAGYHEAIVQVRGIPFDEVSKIMRELEDEIMISDEDFISNVVRVENGADVYVSSISLGRRLSSALKGMGAKVTSTSKLVGQTKDGRKKYRVTFLARFR